MGEVVYIEDFRKAREHKRRKSDKDKGERVVDGKSREPARPASETVKPEDDSA